MTNEMTNLILAENDIASLIAIVVFAIVSIAANAIKKKSDVSREDSIDSTENQVRRIERKRVDSVVPPVPIARRRKKLQKAGSAGSRNTPKEVLDRIAMRIAEKSSAVSSNVMVPQASLRSQRDSAGTRLSGQFEPSQESLPEVERVQNMGDLRTAFVWSEVLGPPVGLRAEAGGWRESWL